MIIAVDGPAASGKGTLSRRLANHLGYAHLDTGKIYRAVGQSVLLSGGDPSDPEIALKAACNLTADALSDPNLTADTVATAASKVAVIDAVRAQLLTFQQNFATTPPDGRPGAILDGRDIGTVVCPDADVKLFVDASVEVRAERRFKELLDRGEEIIYARVLQDLKDRDDRDRNRAVAPLKAASDAFVLDTSVLDPEEAFRAALAIIESEQTDA
ncbi:MAG: (d)CMP kinase [Alphaproteobacteria bacterium]|jgi:cytidylate kinase